MKMLHFEFFPGKQAHADKTQEYDQDYETIVRITDLKKDYRVGWMQLKKFRALDGVSFDVKAGEIFGFLGPNGAGKTTTIKALLGITKPTSGKIEIFGQRGATKAARAHIGYFPETSYYHKYLNPREAVSYYGSLFGLPRAELRKRVDWVLDMMGIYEHRNRLLKTFSKGMLQRLGLAQALINDPALLIMDEPTAGLDPLMKKEMRDIILSLNNQGKTIFFSSHELSEVEMICHRVAILDKGKIIAQGPLSEMVPAQSGLVVVVESIPENVETELQKQNTSISVKNGKTFIRCSADSNIHDVLSTLGANHCDVIDVCQHKKTLEDFFVTTVTQRTRRA